jgi:predicted MFS family arabinose efflux permease
MNTEIATAADRLSRRLRPLYVAQFFQGAVLWYPIEKLFMRQIGFDDAAVGLMAAVYAGATLLIETPSGILADRWSRKGVLVLAAGALLLNALVAGLSNDVPTYIASALILAVFFALNSGTVDSIVFDTVLEETAGSDGFEQRLGRIRVLSSVMSVAGALAGGVLAQLVEPRLAYFATIPFMAVSIVALGRFREPQLHKAGEPVSIRVHVRTTLQVVLQRGALLPIIVVLVATAVLLQVILEFGPLWLVALAAPVFLYGPHGAGLLSSFGLGGLLAGRIRPSERGSSMALVVGVMIGSSLVLVTVHNSVVATIAQIVLAALLVVLSISFTRLLHDNVQSSVRAGVSSAVGSLTWIAFLPFALFFGAISKQSSVFDAGWLVVVATIGLSVVLVRTAIARQVASEPRSALAPVASAV